MKRLNRKGFTLVELLAVIVILAIVVGITLVTVLPTLKKSRQEAFELTANTAADYLEKQYQLYVVGETDTIPDDLQTAFGTLSFDTDGKSTAKDFDAKLITNAGLKPANYLNKTGYNTWYVIQSSGRVCVKLTAATNKAIAAGEKSLATTNNDKAGEYYDATEGGNDITVGSSTYKASTVQSAACTD